MSNLKEWLHKRRGKVFEGETLKQAVDYFLGMVEQGAEVHESKDAIIVLEQHGLPGNYRGYLLFDKFTKGTATAMNRVVQGFTGNALYAATADARIETLLVKYGFEKYHADEESSYLVYRPVK